MSRISVLAAGGLGAAVFLMVSAWSPTLGGDPAAGSDIRVTLEVEDQTVDQALAALSALIGQEIEVKGRIDERRVSVILDGATLDDSLKRELRPRSYIVLWSPEGRLILHVLGDPQDDESPVAHDTPPLVTSDELPPSLFPGGPEGVPPDRPVEPGLTAAGVTDYGSFDIPEVPLDVEVLPPPSPGEAGITQAEFDFENEIRPILTRARSRSYRPPTQGNSA